MMQSTQDRFHEHEHTRRQMMPGSTARGDVDERKNRNPNLRRAERNLTTIRVNRGTPDHARFGTCLYS